MSQGNDEKDDEIQRLRWELERSQRCFADAVEQLKKLRAQLNSQEVDLGRHERINRWLRRKARGAHARNS